MGMRTLYGQLNTNKPPEEVKEALKKSFRSVGGTVRELENSLVITQGTNGVSFAFSADFNASVNLREVKQGKYEIECVINWSMNALSWLCLIIGFFIFGILWIVPLVYLFINPVPVYQQAIDRAQSFLE